MPTPNAFDAPTPSLYGQTKNLTSENQTQREEQGFTNIIGSTGIIDPNFITKIASDPALVAFYVNALTYGGYQMGDILNDIKRRELISKNDPNASSMKPIIDPEKDRATYLSTADGQQSQIETGKYIPTFNFQGLLNPEILKYGANMPDSLTKTLVPPFDPNSAEGKALIDQIKSTYYDLTTAQLQATTEQDKAITDYNYKQYKDQIEKQYGVILSNDATQAWKQIDNLENTFASRGIEGSGLMNEAVDQSLTATRRYDQYARQSKLTQEESQQAQEYLTSATPQQIQSLIEEDKAKGLPPEKWRATLWGLIPSTDVANQYSMETLRQKFPNKTDAELQEMRNVVLDENGNYRSTLYNNYYQNLLNSDINTTAKATVSAETSASNKDANTDNPTTPYTNPPTTPPDSSTTSPSTITIPQHGKFGDADYTPAYTIPNPQTSSAPTSTPVVAKKEDTDTTHEFNIYTGKKNENYKPPIPIVTPSPVITPKKTSPVIKTSTSTGSNSSSDTSNIDSTGTALTTTPQYSPAVTSPKIASSTSSYSQPSSMLGLNLKLPNTSVDTTKDYFNISSNYPSLSSTVSTKTTTSSPYRVQEGDTLYDIATKNNTTVDNLAKLNNISDPTKIYKDQVIKFSLGL